MRQILRLIPFRIGEIPPNIGMNEFKQYLESIHFYFEHINFKLHNKIVFVDCGEHFKSVKCNLCHGDLSMFWQDIVEESTAKGMHNRQLITPCCQGLTFLESLIYTDDVWFGKFIIEITNAIRTFTDQELEDIGRVLGCQIKQIESYYSK